MNEEMINIQRYKFKQFMRQLNYVVENNKIYKKKIEDKKIKLTDIKNIEDIEKLPLTEKKDFFEDYPRGFLLKDEEEIVRYHSSSGTTGKAVIVGFTKNDLKLRNNMVKDICLKAGIKKNDIVQICFGYGMFTGGLSYHEALEELGITIIPSSSGNTEKQVLYMQLFKTTVLITSPSYAMHIYEVAKEKGVDVSKLNVRMLKLGSELLTDAMRKKLKEVWGNKIIINQDYGMTETMGPGLGSECEECKEMHLYDENYIYELIDPISKKPTNKNKGELVISTLNNECFPLIRYATNDIVELDYTKCKCGSRVPRIKKIIGRCDDMIKIKGVKIFLSQVEEFILKHRFCTSNYEVELTRKNYIDEVKIKIEYKYKVNFKKKEFIIKKEELEEKMIEEFKDKFGIRVKIELVKFKTLLRKEGKVKRIKDLRKI